MESRMDEKVRVLKEKGVHIMSPSSVYIADDVDPAMIAGGVTIHPGSRISGKKTSIMEGTVLGREAPVTIEDCQIGKNVELKGGYFKKSVFLEGSNMGLGAHVREACLLEEEAGGAHAVGLKHTILLPFVTLGSLVNLCDCLMAGGTSRKDHSEVGSSYIHFNYTPNQDKATASLLGDVPRGVMLSEKPIFLGGQGGIVGPCIMGFGTVIAAGTVVRDDIYEAGKIVIDQIPKAEIRDFHPGIYWSIRRKTRNNVIYIANLIALMAWYRLVRSQFFGADAFGQALFKGALEKLGMAVDERVKRLDAVAGRMPESMRRYSELMGEGINPILMAQQKELAESWGEVQAKIFSLKSYTGAEEPRDDFLTELITGNVPKINYIEAIKGLDPKTRAMGTRWLDSIVQGVTGPVFSLIPSFS